MAVPMLEMMVIASAALALVALVGCAWLGLALRRARAAWRAELEPLARDVRALCAAGSRAGDRLLRVEGEARRLRERQEQSELQGSGAQGYRHAIALVQRGANPDELIATCGMARGEAELLCLLHGTSQDERIAEKSH